MNAGNIALVVSLISAVAAIGAWWSAHAQATAAAGQLQIMERQDFNQAAASFRAQFVSVQYDVRQNLRGNGRDVMGILPAEVVANHEQAKILFEPHLSSTELQALDEAWQNYASFQKSPAPGSLEQRQKDTKLALELIDSVLSFARPR